MADRDLNINLRLNRSQASMESDRFAAHQRAAIRDVEKAHKESEDAKLNDFRRKMAERARVADQAWTAERSAMRKGREESDLFGSSLAALGSKFAGIYTGAQFARAVGEEFKKARDYSQELAKQVISTKDALASLASVAGRRADNQFALETAVFGAQTGLGLEGGRGFLESFLGRAQLAKGRNISGPEFQRFAGMAGAITAAKGIPVELAGDLLGGVVKAEDFQGKGQGAEAAAARAVQTFKILDAGAGKMALLAPQLAMVMSQVSENALESAIPNAGQAAALVSTMAEFNPGEAAVSVMRGVSGLRDFANQDKAGFFARAGITAKDSAIEAFQKSNRLLAGEVAKGVPVDVALQRFGFVEERENRALRTAFKARETVFGPQVEAALQAPDASLITPMISEYLATEQGQTRQAEAVAAANQLKEGMRFSALEARKTGIKAGMVGERLAPFSRFGYNLMTFYGALGDPEDIIAQRRALEQTGLLPTTTDPATGAQVTRSNFVADVVNYWLNTGAEAANQKLGGGGVPRELIDSLNRLTDRLSNLVPAAPPVLTP